jgi:hypothetical protein
MALHWLGGPTHGTFSILGSPPINPRGGPVTMKPILDALWVFYSQLPPLTSVPPGKSRNGAEHLTE